MSKFILLMLLIISTESFADFVCDANASCLRVVKIAGRRVSQYEDLNCLAVRAACRIKCGNLNADANRYIREDGGDIANIDTALQQNATQQVTTDQLIISNDDMMTRQSNICVDIDNTRNDYLHNISIQKTFASALGELLNLKISDSELQAAIDNSPGYSSREKLILKSFIKSASNSAIDLRTLVDEFKQDTYGNFDKVMSQSIEASIRDCELQKTDISTQRQTLDSQRASLVDQKNNLINERQTKVNHIQEQERRKCS